MHRNGDCHDVSNGFLVITLKVSCSNIVLQSIFMNLEVFMKSFSVLVNIGFFMRGTSPLYVQVCCNCVCVCVCV